MDGADRAAGLESEIASLAVERLAPADAASFIRRLTAILPDATRTLGRLYGDRNDLTDLLRTLLVDALDHRVERDEGLCRLDREREADPAWFQQSRMIGYVCYVDRFGGTLQGVRSHLDHLTELGVNYLHLMPVLRPREGENDGGYAVADYDSIDPRIGTMPDLVELAADLHTRGKSLCVDMVLNHTAREHEWARRAAAGDPFYRGFYLTFPDRRLPDEYERTLPDIFPELAPGNFTRDDGIDGWVWTTFYDWQWDLDYANPDVFRAMLAVMLRLANRGVDVLRLDAAPFLWKQLGTDGQNRPETHLVLQAFRALTRLAAPGLLLKAEAMVGPELLAGYLGAHEVYRPESDLAYDNQLMVMLWSSFATGDARLASQALGRRVPAPAPTSWVTYVRCHDDIGWAVSDVDAAAVGLDGAEHRRFLSEFYAGLVPGSFARGEVFQPDAAGASPISGTLASLCGIEAALDDGDGDGDSLELALRRLESMYSLAFSFGGLPLIYMGDEFALLNDPGARTDPALRDDNRWIHRPPMDWALTTHREDAATVAGRAWTALHALAQARAALPSLAAGEPITLLGGVDARLLAYRRGEPGGGPVVAALNVSATPCRLDAAVLASAGITRPALVHASSGTTLAAGGVEIPACGFAWVWHDARNVQET